MNLMSPFRRILIWRWRPRPSEIREQAKLKMIVRIDQSGENNVTGEIKDWN